MNQRIQLTAVPVLLAILVVLFSVKILPGIISACYRVQAISTTVKTHHAQGRSLALEMAEETRRLATLSELRDSLRRPGNVPQSLARIQKTAALCKLQVASLQGSEAEKSDGLSRFPVFLDAKGPLHSILCLVDKMETGPQIVAVQTIGLVPAISGDDIAVQLRLSVAWPSAEGAP